MESLKELIDRRNQCVADARDILGREARERRLGADEAQKADELLTQAGDLDAQIAERQNDESRRAKLAALEGRLTEHARRITTPMAPGVTPPRGGDGADAVTVQLGRHAVTLRQGTDAHARALADYERRYEGYLRGSYYGRTGAEQLGLQVGDNSKGGYLAPMAMLSALIKFLDDNVFMRRLGTVLPPTAEKSIGVPSYDTDPNDADWTAEVPASSISEDDTARFGRREMSPHLLTKLIKLSLKILRNSSLDLWPFMAGRLGYKFAITEEKAFISGSGAGRPLGVFTAHADGIPTSRDVTLANATTLAADDFINTLYSLKEAYMMRATWLVHRDAVKIARKLKDSQNQYLWAAGLNSGTPGTILDRPIVMSEYAPNTFTTTQYVGVCGDFSYYWIQDGLGLEIQRLDELFSLTNQVGMLGRKETDGAPVLAEAFARMKLA